MKSEGKKRIKIIDDIIKQLGIIDIITLEIIYDTLIRVLEANKKEKEELCKQYWEM